MKTLEKKIVSHMKRNLNFEFIYILVLNKNLLNNIFLNLYFLKLHNKTG